MEHQRLNKIHLTIRQSGPRQQIKHQGEKREIKHQGEKTINGTSKIK